MEINVTEVLRVITFSTVFFCIGFQLAVYLLNGPMTLVLDACYMMCLIGFVIIGIISYIHFIKRKGNFVENINDRAI
jgi:hypothetical protein